MDVKNFKLTMRINVHYLWVHVHNQSFSVSLTSMSFTVFYCFHIEFSTSVKKHLFIRYDVFLCFCYDTNNFYYFYSESKKNCRVICSVWKRFFPCDTHFFIHTVSIFIHHVESCCGCKPYRITISHAKNYSSCKVVCCAFALRFRDDVFFVCVCVFVCMWEIVMENCRDNYRIFQMYVRHVKFPAKKKSSEQVKVQREKPEVEIIFMFSGCNQFDRALFMQMV